ncbi:MAG: hypothetical protein PHR06_05390 [Candidatus Cloacimonetes bacterium]|nr:hypothetical protein [Candidatus Cloacimonadota bacterium]
MRKILVICFILMISLLKAQEIAVRKVLIAFEDTKFKKELAKEMKTILEKEGLVVTETDHSKKGFTELDGASYDLVFITNSGVNSKVRPWVTKWISENENKTKIILHTTQRNDWEVKTSVIAVTSASKTGEVKKFAQDYAEQVMKVLGEPNPLNND